MHPDASAPQHRPRTPRARARGAAKAGRPPRPCPPVRPHHEGAQAGPQARPHQRSHHQPGRSSPQSNRYRNAPLEPNVTCFYLGSGAGVMGACMENEPTPFEVHESGGLLHGTKADLKIGDLLVPGRRSNYGTGRTANHTYVTETLDAATWGAELAAGDGRGRIYVVEPTGTLEDDPNVTDKKFPGNPTKSYRTRDPVRIVGELVEWVGHSPEKLKAR